MQQELELIQNFDNDSKWFHKNINNLRIQNLIGKFVAVENEKVIDANENMQDLVASLERKNKNPNFIFIEFVYPEGYTLLL
jgi:hypothetical protein